MVAAQFAQHAMFLMHPVATCHFQRTGCFAAVNFGGTTSKAHELILECTRSNCVLVRCLRNKRYVRQISPPPIFAKKKKISPSPTPTHRSPPNLYSQLLATHVSVPCFVKALPFSLNFEESYATAFPFLGLSYRLKRGGSAVLSFSFPPVLLSERAIITSCVCGQAATTTT